MKRAFASIEHEVERPPLSFSALELDHRLEIERITSGIRELLAHELRRRGLVVAISGGIDSSVCAALAVRALGASKVFCLILPERDSDPDSEARARILIEHLGVRFERVDISKTLEAIGCYAARDGAVQAILPGYDARWKMKLVISGGQRGEVNRFRLLARSPDGALHERRLDLPTYLAIVAATNFKQRIRKTLEYFHADRLHYAVVGTPNRLELDQGFFVKNGDGSADIKPIAHLYKTQVYAIARQLELPERLQNAQPTTDTFSLEQGQDEFYFGLPYREMDLALWAFERDIPPEELARALDCPLSRAEAIYADIQAKRRTTRYLHLRPLMLGDISMAEAES